ncbi:hypothetical protein [Streptomyces sp. NPDC058872]|uniref:hypothetical protein n=1 Tax=Streptomyces sp. NPDC058872 TaxID=3346661 RepID=UPI003697FC4F
MLIVYSPTDGDVERFDARSLRVSETTIAARTDGRTWPEIRDGLREDLEAMRVVAWVIKKRSHPSLRYGDFDPGVEELQTRLDRDEVKRWAQATAEVAWMDAEATPVSVAAAMRIIPTVADDREHAERVVAELAAERPKDAALPPKQSSDRSETPAS